MIEIDNGILKVSISEVGAEIKSIIKNDTEYIWQGQNDIWSGSSPLLFPICGGLKDNKYIFNGIEYTLNKHGFARFKTFEVEKLTDTIVVFLLKEDDETLKSFPFKFELRVIYTLNGQSLSVNYKVKNLSDNAMFFSIGSHEAYATPEGIEDYDVIFPEKETLNATVLDGELLGNNSYPIIKNSNYLPLYDKFFVIDALVFKSIKSRSATLRNRKTEREIRVDFPDNNYFLLWHKPMSPYICLEPWSGIQDSIHSDYDITKKEGIITLKANCEYSNSHTITIIK